MAFLSSYSYPVWMFVCHEQITPFYLVTSYNKFYDLKDMTAELTERTEELRLSQCDDRSLLFLIHNSAVKPPTRA